MVKMKVVNTAGAIAAWRGAQAQPSHREAREGGETARALMCTHVYGSLTEWAAQIFCLSTADISLGEFRLSKLQVDPLLAFDSMALNAHCPNVVPRQRLTDPLLN
jgi:hypothetical protein